MSAIDRVKAFFDKANVRVITRHTAQAFLTVATAAGLALTALPAQAGDHHHHNNHHHNNHHSRDHFDLRIGPGGWGFGMRDDHFRGSIRIPAPRYYEPRYEGGYGGYYAPPPPPTTITLSQILPNGAENPIGTFDARSTADCVRQTGDLSARTGTETIGICDSPRTGTISETRCSPDPYARRAYCNTLTRRY